MATNFCFQCPLRCSLLLCFGLDINLLFLVRFPVKIMWIIHKPRIFRQRYLGKSWGAEPTLPFLVRMLSPRAQDDLELQRNPVSTNYQRSRVKLWCFFFPSQTVLRSWGPSRNWYRSHSSFSTHLNCTCCVSTFCNSPNTTVTSESSSIH